MPLLLYLPTRADTHRESAKLPTEHPIQRHGGATIARSPSCCRGAARGLAGLRADAARLK
jgi:hypothetical protein